MAKQYGLSFLKKDRGHQIGQVTANKPSIFGEDSDDEKEPEKPTGIAKGLKRQDKIGQEKAIADDPTVYQYDEVFDDIEKKRSDSKLSKKDVEKKPKYIGKLLETAGKRKRENDRRIERQVQKEREDEGDMFKDKESFITPSYKKKLEEMRELEEQEKREEYLESIGDVKKQGNLDGFYRHIYDQKVNYEENDIKKEMSPEIKEESIVEEKESNEAIENHRRNSENTDSISKSNLTKRKYRSRKSSEADSSTDEEPEIKKEHLPSNLDADSDFSINSSGSEDEKPEKVLGDKEKLDKAQPVEKCDNKLDKKQEEPEKKESKIEEAVKVKKKPKIDIWKKRTVGEKFDEAVKRYFERKASRESRQ